MALTLQLFSNNGNINLTKYLNMQPGEGADPAGAAFTTKVLAHSILKPGSTLALEDLKEKLQTFPLKLNAGNKEKLDELVEKINKILNTPGTQVEWVDEGALESTYWDLISGQCDVEYDLRRGEKNYLDAKLRLFVQPLGYYSKKGPKALEAFGGTTVSKGTSPLVVFRANSVLKGDAPSLIQAQILSKSVVHGQVAAVSALPSLEFVPLAPAASYAVGPSGNGGGTMSFSADSFAPTGTMAHIVPSAAGVVYTFTSEEKSKYAYVGENRILLAARTPTVSASFSASANINIIPFKTLFRGQYGAVATPYATGAWRLYDLGIVNSASSYLNSGEKYSVSVYLENNTGASRAIDIGGLIQLPDRNTCWLNTGPIATVTASLANQNVISFDGVANAIRIGANMGVPAAGASPAVASQTTSVIDVSANVRGNIPTIQPGQEVNTIACLVANMYGGTMNAETLVNVNVLERCRYVF